MNVPFRYYLFTPFVSALGRRPASDFLTAIRTGAVSRSLCGFPRAECDAQQVLDQVDFLAASQAQ